MSVASIADVITNPCRQENGVWHLLSADAFPYSDGEKVENYVLRAIATASDISTMSRELEAAIVDWPSRYHLSRERSLAYWPFRVEPGMRVLEVGSGCGSISRYLGETGCDLVCVEASPRRAQITRTRTRDLNNVQVVCAPLESVEYRQKFDLVVCNGVLEYSSTFVQALDPFDSIISKLRSTLASDGSLVVAIENQFGLRYFASSVEDHNGIRFDGIEGYPRFPKGARTFAAATLASLLSRHFSHLEWLYPLSDYKLPTGVIRDSFARSQDLSNLLGSIADPEHAAAARPLFHELLAWRDIARAGLLQVFSNSLIVVAGFGRCRLLDDTWLGDIYALQRRPPFTARTRFRHSMDSSHPIVEKDRLEPTAVVDPRSPLGHTTGPAEWVEGESLKMRLSRLFCEETSRSLVDRISPLVTAWWDSVTHGQSDGLLEGNRIDAVWNNAIVQGTVVRLIDPEWVWRPGVPRAWLLYRAVRQFIHGESRYLHRWARNSRRQSEWQLLRTVAAIAGEPVDLRQLWICTRLDGEFYWWASGYRSTVPRRLVRFLSAAMPIVAADRLDRMVRRALALMRRVVARIRSADA